MDARIIRRIDPQDTEVRELYRKGLRNYQGVGEPANPDGARSAVTPFGAILKYGGISKQDAYVLRRMLRSGPPVMRLCLYDMSLGAFRMAFDNVDECATLSSIYFHVDCQGKNLRTNFARVFSSLCSLDLRCDNPGSRFANDIASCIRNNKSLRELGVYNSCGGDEGAAVLIDTLWRNDTLKKFTLAGYELILRRLHRLRQDACIQLNAGVGGPHLTCVPWKREKCGRCWQMNVTLVSARGFMSCGQ
ncbi:hypothetical protein MTO96_023008 [Rhipicephalus appendiculatus]